MNSIQSRGRFQLIIGISFITGTLGWYLSDEYSCRIIWSATTISIQSLVSIFLSILGTFRYRIETAGSSPTDLLHDKYYASFESSEQAELNLILSECMDYSKRIDNNMSINRKRLSLITWSFILLCSTPLTAIATWLLS